MNTIFKQVIGLYEGRIDQGQFITLGIIMFVCSMVVVSLMTPMAMMFGPAMTMILGTVINTVLLILTMHLYVRRLHDVGTTGYVAVVIIVLSLVHMVFGLLAFLILATLRSMPFQNQFGPVPTKDRPLLQVFLNT